METLGELEEVRVDEEEVEVEVVVPPLWFLPTLLEVLEQTVEVRSCFSLLWFTHPSVRSLTHPSEV